MATASPASILVIDDDRETRELLRKVLTKAGYRVVTSPCAEEARTIGSQEYLDLIIFDVNPALNLSGADILRECRSIHSASEVILTTALGSVETAVAALEGGASGYVLKPLRIEELLVQAGRALRNRDLIRENLDLKRVLGGQVQLPNLVGCSPAMVEVGKKIAAASNSSSPVLIYGEKGAGKELLAKAIHYNSPRAGQPFFAVGCGALTESFLESELWGEFGEFVNGASENQRGAFEKANGGTVFLDEVAAMSPALQAKLLRTLAEPAAGRAGSGQTIPFGVRIIAASTCNLAERVAQGKFRRDLYARLRGIEIELPPLRERPEDIPLLVEHFLNRFGRERGRTFSIRCQALSALVGYDWPGNVRELENTLEAAVALNRSGAITRRDLPAQMRARFRKGSRLEDFYADLPSLGDLGKRYLTHVLKLTKDNKAKTAAILGISRKTLYRMAERLKRRV